MRLNSCATGARVRVVDIDVDPRYLLRVQEIGLRPGTDCQVVRKVFPNGLVINIAGSRVAVNARAARAIEVEPLGAER